MADFEKQIENTLGLLEKHQGEWEGRYAGYAQALDTRAPAIARRKQLFHEYPPLRFYLRISDIKKRESYTPFDVRYRGQSVASMRVYDDKVRIDRIGPNSDRDFETDETFKINEAVDWRSKEATELRRHFRDLGGGLRCGREQNFESLLLTEFSKRKSEGKGLLGIQPVRYCGFRFAVKTPLKASGHGKAEYAGCCGGGIDILARSGRGDATFLTVVEVKNENKPGEPAVDAVEQGIAYAVFLIKLLRSGSGAVWYRLFGFKRPLPEKLIIRVACAMPYPIKGEYDRSFGKRRLPVGGDEIECHYIYFTYDEERDALKDFVSSL